MLLAVACAVLTLKFSFYSGNKLGGSPGVSPAQRPSEFTYLTASSNILLLILTVIVIAGGLFAIFNFKNRKFQLRVVIGLILLSLVNIFLFWRETNSPNWQSGNYALTALLALATPFFFFFAARGIYKDERLVKNADRLR